MWKFLRYENFTAQEANAIIFLRITYSRIFTVFTLPLPVEIACCFKCGIECYALKSCVLTEIAQVKCKRRAVAAILSLGFMIYSLTNSTADSIVGVTTTGATALLARVPRSFLSL